MKKFIFALFLALAVPTISFADIATGPDFSNGFGFDDVLEIAVQYAPIILAIIVLALIVGIVLIVKHFKKRNVNLPR